MSYPASTTTLKGWVEAVDQKATALKAAAQQQNTLSAAGTLSMALVARFYDTLISANVLFTQAAAITGIGTYLANEKQGQSADPVADFNSMAAAVISTLNWLRANVPTGTFNAVTYQLGYVFPADNVTPSSTLVYTAAQTAGYRTTLTALIATIG